MPGGDCLWMTEGNRRMFRRVRRASCSSARWRPPPSAGVAAAVWIRSSAPLALRDGAGPRAIEMVVPVMDEVGAVVHFDFVLRVRALLGDSQIPAQKVKPAAPNPQQDVRYVT